MPRVCVFLLLGWGSETRLFSFSAAGKGKTQNDVHMNYPQAFHPLFNQ
jgi:hypothetical protein